MKRRGAVLAIALAPLGFAPACVDGTTPDCSDAATGCGPGVDGSPERIEAALPDASRPDTAPVDAGSEAAPDAADADLDAGDEG